MLDRCDWLWDVLRGPYERFLDANGRGVSVTVGGHADIRTPAEWAGYNWETYEPAAVRAAADWAKANPGGLFLDVGCAVGVFSAVVLFAGRSIQAIAFDSDLASCAATRRFCRHVPGGTVRLVHGFVSDTGTGKTLAIAEAETYAALALCGDDLGGPGTNRYTNIGDGHGGVPSNRTRRSHAEKSDRGPPHASQD